MVESIVRRMHNPPHPGEVLKEYLGNLTLTEAASCLFIGRNILQDVVSGTVKISPEIAGDLSVAFGTSSELWVGLQSQYHLYQASKIPARKNIDA